MPLIRPAVGFVALLIVLLLAGRVAAEEAAVLGADGTPVGVRLSGERTMQRLTARAPAGAKALHVVAVAPYDVDLYLHGVALEEDELDSARYSGNTASMVEHLVVRPNAGDTFAQTADWYAHVMSPWARPKGLAASVAAYVEREEPVLVPGEARRLEIPAGKAQAVARVVVPDGLSAVAVRVEGVRGVPAIRGTLRKAEIPGLRRANHALVYLAGHPDVTAGAWRLAISRPGGTSSDAPYPVLVTASVVARMPEDDAWQEGEPQPLRGLRGEKTFHIDRDGNVDFFLDVSPSVYSVRFDGKLPVGDLDLYATPDRPVESGGSGNWRYAAWKDGHGETLFVGGTKPLPVGRYWVRARHVGGDGGEATLTWHCRARALDEEEQLPTEGPIGPAVWLIEMGPNEPTLWWDLMPPAGPGTYVQVFGSDKNVDLLLMRVDTGATLVRRVSPLVAERLRVPPDLVIPEDAGLRIGLCRWNVTSPVVVGELHVSIDEPPKPPANYFPPYPTFGLDSRSQTLAAAAHLETDDGTGSGVVVSPTGLILTCHHVIEDVLPGGEIYVSLPIHPRGRPRQLYHAQVVDSVKGLDLALLELTKDVFGHPVPPERKHPCVPLGSSRALPLEAKLRIVGYGYAGSSSFASNLNVLHGILAGVEMEGDRERWLITDARLGAGNSGAGFFDEAGRLVGIHSCSYGETGSSLNYARPVSCIPEAWLERIAAEGGTVAVE